MTPNQTYHLLAFCLNLLLLESQTLSQTVSNSFEIRDLFLNGDEFKQSVNTWTVSVPNTYTKYFNCSGTSFLGDWAAFWGSNSYVVKTYNIPQPHNVIYYTIVLSLKDEWYSSNYLTVTFGGSGGTAGAPGVTVSLSASYSLGSCYVTDFKIKGKISHSDSVLTLQINRRYYPSGTFGFRKIFLRSGNDGPPAASENLCVRSYYFDYYSLHYNDKCSCPQNQFMSGSTCTNCDVSCEECFGPTSSECFACKFGFYYDGVKCTQCTPNCTDCGTCNVCSDYNFYMHGACVATCSLPFLAVTSGERRYCFSPCKETEIVFSDGTCTSECNYPFILAPIGSRKLCKSPCPPGKNLYYNQSCSTATCPYPLFDKIYGGAMKVCEYPCSIPGEIYYQHNGTCQTSCIYPFVIKYYGNFSVCQPPCHGTDFLRYWNDSCSATCPLLLQKRLLNDVWVCDPPQCGGKFCDQCGPLYSCPEFYYCNTTQGTFCMPYNSYKLAIQLVRPILNGVVLSAVVTPLLGILGGANDILSVEIGDLKEGVDYVVSTEKMSKGHFQVEIVILKKISEVGTVSMFTYAPRSVAVKANYTLPRITYISQEIQGTAMETARGSQIAFLIFVITLVGCISGGGLSAVWTALPESQYAFYLMYLNVDFLHHTEVYFESLSNYDVLLGNSGDENPHLDLSYKNSLPRRFFNRDYSPDFLEHSLEVFTQAMVSFGVLTISALLVRYVRFSGRGILLIKALRFIRKLFMWNLIIRQIMTYSLPLSLASFIQIYHAIFDDQVGLWTLLLPIATLTLYLWFFKKMISMIDNIPRDTSKAIKYTQRFGTLWEDLNMASFSTGKYYYWLVAMRGCLLSYLTVFISVYPKIQIIIMIIYQSFILSLFFKEFRIRAVFEDMTLNRVTLIEEACLLALKIMIFVFLVSYNTVSDKTLILMGWLIIVPAAVSQGIQTIYSVWSKVGDIKKIEAVCRWMNSVRGKNKKRRIRRIKRITRIQKVTRVQ